MPPSGNSLFASLAVNCSLPITKDSRKGNLKSLLNCLQDLLISLTAHEGNRKALGSEAAGTANTMEVRIRIAWKVVVDSEINALDINTTAEHISGDADTLVKFFELFVPLDTADGVSKALEA